MNAGFDYVYDTVSSSFVDGQLWIVRGGVPSAIPGAGKGSVNPIPRPDGKALLVKRLAPSGGPDGGGLAVVDLNGKRISAVPRTAGCFPGGWVDASTIVISCGGDGGTSWHVIRLRVDGSDRQVIAPDDSGDPPSVSPNGKLVAYGYQHQTWVVPTAGGTPRVVQPESEGGSWAPDGKHLAVTGKDAGADELFLVAADGSGSKGIAEIDTEALATFDTFSPDGRSVLLGGSSDTPYAFTVVPVNGSAQRPLDESKLAGDPQRLP